ncbi:helix-turn-helix domain-containing protein [Empedobacter brevis]|uniref:helix-turn-helix domain-containing protein n=1 Tax=Empedobacter brevis TaxID=247 RepID=UPI00289BC258|nr:helix-turn-helix domain-containing protein [Empedobacter brevis]
MQRKNERDLDFLTVSDLAEKFKISRNTIYKWNQKKKLPYFKIGKRVYYLLDDVERFMMLNQVLKRDNTEMEIQNLINNKYKKF